MSLDASATRLLAMHPRQPDRRSCGASVLVVERALRDDDYAAWLADDAARFRDEVLGTHGRTTGLVTAAGSLQLPWPRSLGTPPWAIANQLSATTGRRWTYREALRRAPALDTLVHAVQDGHPSPLYVGSRWLPRHVVLVLEASSTTLQCYEPSSGRVLTITRNAFLEAAFRLAGWTTPWFVVVPT
jgi:hypothetical protein